MFASRFLFFYSSSYSFRFFSQTGFYGKIFTHFLEKCIYLGVYIIYHIQDCQVCSWFPVPDDLFHVSGFNCPPQGHFKPLYCSNYVFRVISLVSQQELAGTAPVSLAFAIVSFWSQVVSILSSLPWPLLFIRPLIQTFRRLKLCYRGLWWTNIEEPGSATLTIRPTATSAKLEVGVAGNLSLASITYQANNSKSS